MKNALSLLACLGLLLASASRGFAADQEPILRETKDWIIISGISASAGDPQNGPLPWSFAIKKSTILSVTLGTSHRVLSDKDHRPINYQDAAPEEIGKLPADVRIITSELTGSGNKSFHIDGLTHASAPAMLEKIIAAAGSSGETGKR